MPGATLDAVAKLCSLRLLYDDYSTTVSVSRELTALTGGIAIKIEGWDGKDTLVLCCWWNKLSSSPL